MTQPSPQMSLTLCKALHVPIKLQGEEMTEKEQTQHSPSLPMPPHTPARGRNEERAWGEGKPSQPLHLLSSPPLWGTVFPLPPGAFPVSMETAPASQAPSSAAPAPAIGQREPATPRSALSEVFFLWLWACTSSLSLCLTIYMSLFLIICLHSFLSPPFPSFSLHVSSHTPLLGESFSCSYLSLHP